MCEEESVRSTVLEFRDKLWESLTETYRTDETGSQFWLDVGRPVERQILSETYRLLTTKRRQEIT